MAAAQPSSGGVRSRVYLPALLIPASAVVLIGAGWAIGWGGVDFAIR